jgi:serine/threonine protein kinase
LGEEHLHNEHDLTTVGQLMGTLDYMSPEQGLDSHDVDSRTDIFSLGATLFKLLSGKAPLETLSLTTPLKKLTSLATKPLPSIGSVRKDLPENLVKVIDKMLARDPDDRYADAREVAEALQPFCAQADLASLLRRALAAVGNEPTMAWRSLHSSSTWRRTRAIFGLTQRCLTSTSKFDRVIDWSTQSRSRTSAAASRCGFVPERTTLSSKTLEKTFESAKEPS